MIILRDGYGRSSDDLFVLRKGRCTSHERISDLDINFEAVFISSCDTCMVNTYDNVDQMINYPS